MQLPLLSCSFHITLLLGKLFRIESNFHDIPIWLCYKSLVIVLCLQWDVDFPLHYLFIVKFSYVNKNCRNKCLCLFTLENFHCTVKVKFEVTKTKYIYWIFHYLFCLHLLIYCTLKCAQILCYLTLFRFTYDFPLQ